MNASPPTVRAHPVLKQVPSANTYHGYGIHNFIGAEPRFADDPTTADNELRALVDAAHQQDLLVIFDIVLNHAGREFDYERPEGVSAQFADRTRYSFVAVAAS